MYRMFVRAVLSGLYPLFRRWQLVCLTFLSLGLSVYLLKFRALRGTPTRFGGAFAMAEPGLISDWLPVLVGLTSSGALAAELRVGFTELVRSRGLSRSYYVLTRAAATALTSLCMTWLAFGTFLLVAAVVLPWGNSEIVTEVPGALESLPGPVPALFARNPLLNDLLGLAMLGAASMGLSLFGLLSGVVSNSRYLAGAMPLVGYIFGTRFFVGPLRSLNPGRFLDVFISYRDVPQGAQPWAGFAYWIGLGGILTLLSIAVFKYREEA